MIQCFVLFYTEYAEKTMHKLYKQWLIHSKKANLVAVFLPSRCRNFYYEI